LPVFHPGVATIPLPIPTMTPDPRTEEHRINEVARRPGGWTLRVGTECRPVFVGEAEVAQPPAAGDRLRTHPDGRREVVR
jgi:hypothetical protein